MLDWTDFTGGDVELWRARKIAGIIGPESWERDLVAMARYAVSLYGQVTRLREENERLRAKCPSYLPEGWYDI